MTISGGSLHAGRWIETNGSRTPGSSGTERNSRRQARRHSTSTKLEAVDEQHGEHRRGAGQKYREGDPVGRAQVVLERDRREPDERRGHDLHERPECDQRGEPEAAKCEREPGDERRREERPPRAPWRARGVGLERARERELRRADPRGRCPVGARAAFRGLLPRLVRTSPSGSSQGAVRPCARGTRGRSAPAPRARRSPRRRGRRGSASRSRRSPRAFSGKRASAPRSAKGVVHRVLGRHAFPVGQQVDGDEVDVARELGYRSHTCQGSAVDTGFFVNRLTRFRYVMSSSAVRSPRSTASFPTMMRSTLARHGRSGPRPQPRCRCCRSAGRARPRA